MLDDVSKPNRAQTWMHSLKAKSGHAIYYIADILYIWYDIYYNIYVPCDMGWLIA